MSSTRDYEISVRARAASDTVDFGDPFARAAVLTALTERLRAEPLVLETPFGPVTVEVGLVTAVA